MVVVVLRPVEEDPCSDSLSSCETFGVSDLADAHEMGDFEDKLYFARRAVASVG